MATIYLNANFGGGIYENSKTEKPGFEKHVSSKNNVSYRRELRKGLFGIFRGAELRDSKIGQQISMKFTDADNNTIYFQVPFKDSKGDIGTFAESIITRLPFMEKDKYIYRLFAYAMEQPGTTYKKVGISVHFASDYETVMNGESDAKVGRLSYSYTTKAGEVVVGDIPQINWTQNFEGKNVADKSAKNTYLYQTLAKFATIQQAQPDTTTQQVAPTTQTVPPVQKAAPVVQTPPPPTPQTQQTVSVQQAVPTNYVAPPTQVNATDDLPF